MLDTPIIVSDEEIKEGDWYNSNLGINKLGKSTRNVENWRQRIVFGYGELPSIDFNEFEEQLGIFDVEKLALETYRDNPNDLKEANYKYNTDLNAPRKRRAFVRGFQAAQKLNEKKFSLEDMANLWQFIVDGAKQLMLSGTTEVSSFDDYIKSLQQPKIFDIEVEMEQVLKCENTFDENTTRKTWVNTGKFIPKITNNRIKITKIL